MSTFASRLAALDGAARLCVGVDPHTQTLEAWGLADTAEGIRAFSQAMLDAMVESSVALTKPQVALFERHGIDGMRALAQFIGEARAQGISVIADVKRGDIGTSLAGYAAAWLAPGGDFEADAMTAVAYQGVGSLEPALEMASDGGKGVFVLAGTSNPEGWPVQSARVSTGETVAGLTVAEVARRSREISPDQSGWLGVVIGATVDRTEMGIEDDHCSRLSILAPGFGAQGAALSSLYEVFGQLSPNVIPTVSRSAAGTDADNVVSRIKRHQEELQES